MMQLLSFVAVLSFTLGCTVRSLENNRDTRSEGLKGAVTSARAKPPMASTENTALLAALKKQVSGPAGALAFGAGPSTSINESHPYHLERFGAAPYRVTFQHSSQDGSYWELGLGHGGQIASILSFQGEMIGAQVPLGKWIDRVLQLVYVNGAKNTLAAPYAIHQAGTYQADGLSQPFYSPTLASEYDPATHSLTQLVWPQQAHIPTAHQSRLLLLQTIKDLGGGVIEVSATTYNFGTNEQDDFVDLVSAPWSGFSRDNIPSYIYGAADKGWQYVPDPTKNWGDRIISLSESLGWAAFLNMSFQNPHMNNRMESSGISVVLGREHVGISNGRGEPLYRQDGIFRGGSLVSEDVNVFEGMRFINFRPGDALVFRYYLVINQLAKIHSYSNELVSQAGITVLPQPSNLTLVGICRAEASYTNQCSGRAPLFYAAAEWSAKAQPLFLVKNLATGEMRLSLDPYAFSASPYDGKTKVVSFLGWLPHRSYFTNETIKAKMQSLSEISLSPSLILKGFRSDSPPFADTLVFKAL